MNIKTNKYLIYGIMENNYDHNGDYYISTHSGTPVGYSNSEIEAKTYCQKNNLSLCLNNDWRTHIDIEDNQNFDNRWTWYFKQNNLIIPDYIDILEHIWPLNINIFPYFKLFEWCHINKQDINLYIPQTYYYTYIVRV